MLLAPAEYSRYGSRLQDKLRWSHVLLIQKCEIFTCYDDIDVISLATLVLTDVCVFVFQLYFVNA